MATVYIGGASIDERGKASGGQAGNQTGRELRKQAYYCLLYTSVYELATPTTETPDAVDPIVPQSEQVNLFTDGDALSATIHGSGWDTISDQAGLLATIAQLTARVAALEQAAVNESTGG